MTSLKYTGSCGGTEKQRAARIKNRIIFQLRGMHSNAGLLSDARERQIQELIDQELAELGAETESSRRERIHDFYTIDPRNLPEGMSKEEYDKLAKNLLKPFGGRNVQDMRKG